MQSLGVTQSLCRCEDDAGEGSHPGTFWGATEAGLWCSDRNYPAVGADQPQAIRGLVPLGSCQGITEGSWTPQLLWGFVLWDSQRGQSEDRAGPKMSPEEFFRAAQWKTLLRQLLRLKRIFITVQLEGRTIHLWVHET